jgi:hypothetical protein
LSAASETTTDRLSVPGRRWLSAGCDTRISLRSTGALRASRSTGGCGTLPSMRCRGMSYSGVVRCQGWPVCGGTGARWGTGDGCEQWEVTAAEPGVRQVMSVRLGCVSSWLAARASPHMLAIVIIAWTARRRLCGRSLRLRERCRRTARLGIWSVAESGGVVMSLSGRQCSCYPLPAQRVASVGRRSDRAGMGRMGGPPDSGGDSLLVWATANRVPAREPGVSRRGVSTTSWSSTCVL